MMKKYFLFIAASMLLFPAFAQKIDTKQENQFKNPNWQNLANILAPSLKKLLFPNSPPPFATQVIPTDISRGTNTIPHGLGGRPNIIQFWQNNLWLAAGFYTIATATALTIESTDDYTGIEIDLIRF